MICNLIHFLGLGYTHTRKSAWTERVTNAALIANRFDSGNNNWLNIPGGPPFNRMIHFGCDGGYVVPEVRGSFVFAVDKSRPSVTAGYAGAPGGARMVGVDPGLSGRMNSRVDFRVDYDFETRSGFRGHTLNASLGLSF